MSQNRSLYRTLVLVVVTLAVGLFAGRYLAIHPLGQAAPSSGSGQSSGLVEIMPTSSKDQQKKKTYVCPMHPEIVQDHEGNCPICGMALVSADKLDGHSHETVSISPQLVNNLSVKLATVKKHDIVRFARLPAYIQGFTPGMGQVVRSSIAGKLIHLSARLGNRVRAGDVLFEIEVPGAAEAQAGHLEVLKGGDESAINESRMKLRELGLTGDDIKALEVERKPAKSFKYRAAMDGVVSNVQHAAGDMIRPGEAVVALQGRGVMIVDVDLFQTEALWLKDGDRAELSVRQLPGQVWKTMVDMKRMKNNPEKRTYGLSLDFPMESSVLSNDMFGEVTVTGLSRRNVPAIPRDALIRTEGHNRVIQAFKDGHFRAVEVKPGAEDGNNVEILSGLKLGDSVVVSSQFLLDSESSMRAEIQRMTGADMPDQKSDKATMPKQGSAASHDMGAMSKNASGGMGDMPMAH